MRRITLVTALIALTAGCVSLESRGIVDSASFEAHDPLGGLPDPLVVDHDHADATLHALATPDFALLHHASLPVAGAVPGPAFAEMDLLGDDHLLVSTFAGGFYVVDVTDRAAPVAVSFTPVAGIAADAKASESGNFAFVGVQMAGFTGIHAFNVQVPEAPVLAGAWPLTNGCHMLAVFDGHVYCAPNDATVRIFRYTESGPAVTLEPVGAYAPKGAPLAPVHSTRDGVGDELTHDMTLQADPLTGDPVMIVSFWDYGVRVVDVADPANPVELAAWQGEGADPAVYEGNVHTSVAFRVGDRRIIATVPEWALAPALTFVDATDYEHVTALGQWVPKPAEEWGDASRTFSTHNLQVVHGRVYLAMYHGGVWVIDASTPTALARPTALAYHLPHELRDAPVPAPVPFLGGGPPNVWDVVLKDGHVYATDIGTGLYVLHYAGDTRGDASATSFA